jgi:hypothetical protein
MKARGQRITLSIVIASAIFLSAASPSPQQAQGSSSPGSYSSPNQSQSEQKPFSFNDFSKTPQGNNPTATNTPDGNEHREEKAIAISTVVQAVCAVLLVAFTGLLARYTYQTAQTGDIAAGAAAKAAQAAEDALHVDRAFLLVTGFELTQQLRDGSNNTLTLIFQFRAILRNFGVGPADIVNYVVEAELFNLPPPDPNPIYGEGSPINDSLIAPGDIANDRIYATISLNSAESDAVMRGQKRIGLHGIIRYRGASARQYWSRFFWWVMTNDMRQFARAYTKELNDHT